MKQDELRGLLLRHYEKYPLMRVADMFKLIYQNEFGCGHMVSDEARSLGMIAEEAAGLPAAARERDNAEPVGNGLCRLYLNILREDLSAETLNRFFVLTAQNPRGSAEGFERKAALFKQLCEDGELPFNAEEVSAALEQCRADNYPAARHSAEYRRAYAPAYRVVDKRFCDFLPLFRRIDTLAAQKDRVLCAIDGGCASGKSTLAALLKSVYDCNVFSMDEFFLQPFQRTEKRLREPGGNVDYERFNEEVLTPLAAGKPFAYRPYDCGGGELAGEIAVTPRRLNIVEGVYCLHPALAGAYNIKVFLEIGAEEQKERLLKRNKAMYNRFVREWLPMENSYFNAYEVSSQCGLVFTC